MAPISLRTIPFPGRVWRWPVVAVPMLACSGCDMLGALFDTRHLRMIVLVVVVVAVVGFIVSRATRR